MCGVMKSFWSAIIFEQQWFGHHRQKEESHQTHQRRIERKKHDPRQWGVQHQHNKSHQRTDSPPEEQRPRSALASTRRPKQRVRAQLYRESESSTHQHRSMFGHRPEEGPQNYGSDYNESAGHTSKEFER